MTVVFDSFVTEGLFLRHKIIIYKSTACICTSILAVVKNNKTCSFESLFLHI